MPAVHSADRCNFWESETDCSRNGNNLYKSWVERALNSGPFGHFRFANRHFNWQILVKVWTPVIGLSCLMRTILEYEKARQIWTLLLRSLQYSKTKKSVMTVIAVWRIMTIWKKTLRIEWPQPHITNLSFSLGHSCWHSRFRFFQQSEAKIAPNA